MLTLTGSCLTEVSEGVWGEHDHGAQPLPRLGVPRALSGPSSPSVLDCFGPGKVKIVPFHSSKYSVKEAG